jgi:hypothetical protein
MAWFLRAIEQDNGSWECRWARAVYGIEPDIEAAVQRLHTLAHSLAVAGSFELLLHHLDGTVTHLGPAT